MLSRARRVRARRVKKGRVREGRMRKGEVRAAGVRQTGSWDHVLTGLILVVKMGLERDRKTDRHTDNIMKTKPERKLPRKNKL